MTARRTFAALLFAVALVSSHGSTAADPIVRGLYWNFRHTDTFDNIDGSLSTLQALGVRRVHFWMNEPPVPRALLKCDRVRFGFA